MESQQVNYYGILGLTKQATDTEIKEAYKSLALKNNPLRANCSDDKLYSLFTQIGEAYEVLSNPRLKSTYDQYGEGALKKGAMTLLGFQQPWVYHGCPFQTFKNFFGSANPYTDIIYSMHETMSKKNPNIAVVKKKAPPIERTLELTLEEVYFGTIKKMKIQRHIFMIDQLTPRIEEKVLQIRILPGTPEGTKLIFKNVGNEDTATIPADLIITTKDKPHEKFRREGVNLCKDVTLSIVTALEDVIIELTTIDCRTIRFAVTDLIAPGYKKIIQNEGMPYVKNNRKKGDLIITFHLTYPKYLPENVRKKIIEALLSSENPETERDSPEVIEKLFAAQRRKYTRGSQLFKKDSEEKEKVECEDFINLNKDSYIQL